MNVRKTITSALALAVILCAQSSQAAVISGSISGWPESGALMSIGDGSNNVTMWWSINTTDRGWFYGSGFTTDSDVAFASGVSAITQITDASIFSFTSGSSGPHCDANCSANGVGDFMLWRNISTGHYGALRIDDIIGNGLSATLDGTWWFQTDGSSDFSSAVVPLPAALPFLLTGLASLGLIGRRRRA